MVRWIGLCITFAKPICIAAAVHSNDGDGIKLGFAWYFVINTKRLSRANAKPTIVQKKRKRV